MGEKKTDYSALIKTLQTLRRVMGDETLRVWLHAFNGKKNIGNISEDANIFFVTYDTKKKYVWNDKKGALTEGYFSCEDKVVNWKTPLLSDLSANKNGIIFGENNATFSCSLAGGDNETFYFWHKYKESLQKYLNSCYKEDAGQSLLSVLNQWVEKEYAKQIVGEYFSALKNDPEFSDSINEQLVAYAQKNYKEIIDVKDGRLSSVGKISDVMLRVRVMQANLQLQSERNKLVVKADDFDSRVVQLFDDIKNNINTRAELYKEGSEERKILARVVAFLSDEDFKSSLISGDFLVGEGKNLAFDFEKVRERIMQVRCKFDPFLRKVKGTLKRLDAYAVFLPTTEFLRDDDAREWVKNQKKAYRVLTKLAGLMHSFDGSGAEEFKQKVGEIIKANRDLLDKFVDVGFLKIISQIVDILKTDFANVRGSESLKDGCAKAIVTLTKCGNIMFHPADALKNEIDNALKVAPAA